MKIELSQYEVSEIIANHFMNSPQFPDTNELKVLLSAVDIFKKLELKENKDYAVKGDMLCLYTHLNLRDKFNALFVKAGIDVKKVNLREENLEDFFTRFVSNN